MYKNQKNEEDSVVLNVPIILIEGRIIVNGKVGLHHKDNNLHSQKSGKNVLNLSIKEMIQLVKNMEKGIVRISDIRSIYTTLSHLSIKNIEQILIILYYFAKSVIDGHIQKKISTINILLKFKDGYTYSVSDTQRYKMIGNGFNVNTIVHILKGLQHEPYVVRKKEPQLFSTKPQQPTLFAC